jgi:hypothetical protein
MHLEIQLPTGMDILQHLAYLQSKLPKTIKKVSLVTCLLRKNFERCENLDCNCVLAKVKKPWIKAGFEVVSDTQLLKNLMRLDKQYFDLKKKRKKRFS